MKSISLIATVTLANSVAAGPDHRAGTAAPGTTRFRGPVALEWLHADESLLVLNGRSGTLSTLRIESDPSVTAKLIGETELGGTPRDFHLLPDANLAVVDGDSSSLRIYDIPGPGAVAFLQEIDLPEDPVRMAVSPDGSRIAVASRWSRRIAILTVSGAASESDSNATRGPRIHPSHIVDLGFAPGELIFTESTELIVADRFGGTLARIDAATGDLLSTTSLPACNIAGLVLDASGEEPAVWLTAQSLNSRASTLRSEITWGVLMNNHLRRIPLADLRTAGDDGISLGRVFGLGDEVGPGGDPGAIARGPDGTLVLTLSGVDRLGVKRPADRAIQRIDVGDRPVDVQLDSTGRFAFVADHFSDTVSVVDLPAFERIQSVSLGPTPELTAADRGERLFYDAGLSIRGWFSCHSCHTDGHSTGMLADNLGDDEFGTPKQILSLLGVGDTEPVAWLGTSESLESQVFKSIEKTMRGTPPTQQMAEDLAAYLRTLQPPPPLSAARSNLNPDHVNAGRAVFEQSGCGDCHRPPTYTSPRTYDVGLVDEAGHDHFNPPSLRGVSQREQFLHDGRARDLEAVFREFRHPDGEVLSERDLTVLTEFLRSL